MFYTCILILVEPKRLEEWADESSVALYTYVDAHRPWIQDFDLAMNISYYQSLASSIWLFDHQLDSPLLRWFNRFFVWIAQKRCDHNAFFLTFDKKIYSWFRLKVYQRFERLAREREAARS